VYASGLQLDNVHCFRRFDLITGGGYWHKDAKAAKEESSLGRGEAANDAADEAAKIVEAGIGKCSATARRLKGGKYSSAKQHF
jgi:hypothetical protein